MEQDEITKLYKARKTIIQMLSHRGYFVSQQYWNESLEEFKQNVITRDRANLLVSKEKDINDRLIVFFSDAEKFEIKELENYLKVLYDKDILRGIVVIKRDITSRCKEAIKQLEEIKIDLFEQDELLVNITEHELVPTHCIISQEEKDVLLKKYRVKESQLPKILKDDPIARYFGVRRGDVLKIIRNSETAGKYITYRIVI